MIEVADTGSGIPAPDRARIFDRFYRAGDRDGGFGLGLSIAREAVRTLGGEIELESEQSVGTTVGSPDRSGAGEPAPALLSAPSSLRRSPQPKET